MTYSDTCDGIDPNEARQSATRDGAEWPSSSGASEPPSDSDEMSRWRHRRVASVERNRGHQRRLGNDAMSP